ncbi:MAG: lamin tail domain-containing protein [Halobacteriaceae archaeon]
MAVTAAGGAAWSGGDAPSDGRRGVTARVVNVVDGDTVHVRYPNGTRATVRLLGVDTPETRGALRPEEFEGVPDTEAGRSCLRGAATAATEYVETRVAGANVRLVFDRLADRRDAFGRLLAYVYLDGENLNYALVAEGYARVYDSPFEQSERFYAAEAAARSAGTGVWRCARGGESDAALRVVEVRADPPGDDREDLNGEYVRLRNGRDRPLDLTGWTVSDEAGHVYRFPDGFTLGAGATVTLHTGSGADAGTDLYWGAPGPVWNNAGDTVVVRDADGQVVTRWRYA